MEITIDTSAILAVIVGEDEREAIVGATAGHSLVAPGSVPWEVGNAFTAMFKRDRVTVEEAMKGLEIFAGIPIRYAIPSLERAVKIAHDNAIYAYDAYVIECAMRFKGPLLTLDRGLERVALELGVSCLEV